MALVVETGVGVVGADSYNTLTELGAYHAGRSNAAWAAASQQAQEAAARYATAYMVTAYRMRWGGSRVSSTQALDWPRYMVPMLDAPFGYRAFPAYYPNNSVPQPVKDAQAELALLALDGPLNPPISRVVLREKIGPLETDYDPASAPYTIYRDIDMRLAPMLLNGGQVRVQRG